MSVLDARETVFVSPAQLAELGNLREMLARAGDRPPPKEEGRISLGGTRRFAADPKLSNQVRITYEIDRTDLDAMLLAVMRRGRARAWMSGLRFSR